MFELLLVIFQFIIIVALLKGISKKGFSGLSLKPGVCWALEETPALNTFIMFVLQAQLIITAIACFCRNISNHIIINLDIIYFASILILVMFHIFKEACLVKEF